MTALTPPKDPIAIVTGAASGIGLRVAETLVAKGIRTACLDNADTFAIKESTTELALPCDITDETEVERAVSFVEKRWGRVQILINNAGAVIRQPMLDTTLTQWRAMLEVNLTGAFLMSRRVLPGMAASNYGRLVHVGSMVGRTGGSGNVAAYAAAKAGLHTLAKSIAVEFAACGVTSNVVAPAWIRTEMTVDGQAMADRIPVRRLGTPDEVAELIAFLASSQASFITGTVIDCNGGLSMS